MKAWGRYCISQSEFPVGQSNCLKAISELLKQEIKSKECLLLAHTSFGSGSRMTTTQTHEENLPTAAFFFLGEGEKNERTCI
jgi:hypothetical protein